LRLWRDFEKVVAFPDLSLDFSRNAVGQTDGDLNAVAAEAARVVGQ
jgi:hypothetical protein